MGANLGSCVKRGLRIAVLADPTIQQLWLHCATFSRISAAFWLWMILLPRLLLKIPHLKIRADVAGKDIRPRVNEHEICSGGAGDEAVVPQYFFDQPKVEVRSEPVFDAFCPQLRCDQPFDLPGNPQAVVRQIIALVELEAVVQGTGGQLKAVLLGELVQTDKILNVIVLDGDRVAQVGAAQLLQAFEAGGFDGEAVLFAADAVAGVCKAVQAEADLDIGELTNDGFKPFRVQAVAADLEHFGFGMQDADDFKQVGAQGGLAAGDVEVVETARQLLQRGQ